MQKERFREAVELFDMIHRQESETCGSGDGECSDPLLYHKRLTYWVERLSEQPSEALLLAARCQHLRRKAIPRSQFPLGREGYRNWRSTLAEFHARKAAEILKRVGYPQGVIGRVEDLLLKKRLKLDPEVQLFEDAICLVFLELELPDFARKHDATKLVEILRKTWKKMSSNGQQLALKLVNGLSKEIRDLLLQACERDGARKGLVG